MASEPPHSCGEHSDDAAGGWFAYHRWRGARSSYFGYHRCGEEVTSTKFRAPGSWWEGNSKGPSGGRPAVPPKKQRERVTAHLAKIDGEIDGLEQAGTVSV